MDTTTRQRTHSSQRRASQTRAASEKRAISQRICTSGARLTAIFPSIFALIAFILTLLIVIAGSKNGSLSGYNLINLNTSKVGQNVIQFTPATATSTGSATRPTVSTGTSVIDNGLNSIGDFFGTLLQNITAGIDGSLNSAEAQLVQGITSQLGIQQQYSFYLLGMCSGSLSNGESAGCTSYKNTANGLTNLTNVVPSSFIIGTTKVSIPILGAVSSTGSLLTNIFNILSNSIFAFYVISLITSVIVALLSISMVFLSTASFANALVYTTMVFSIIGITFHLISSIVISVIIGLANSVINSFTDSLGVQSSLGVSFLATTWIAWVLFLLAGEYWIFVWFVEVRTHAFKARYRTLQEMGDYKGIFRELLSDLRRPKKTKVVENREEAYI